jgi:hypothetical protein
MTIYRWLCQSPGLIIEERLQTGAQAPTSSLGAEQEAAEERAIARDDPVSELYRPDERAASREPTSKTQRN